MNNTWCCSWAFSIVRKEELAESYVSSLLMDGDHKPVEPMPERINAPERSMRRLLSQVKWDEQGVLSAYRGRMLATSSDPMEVLLIDDTSFPKKEQKNVCVSRHIAVPPARQITAKSASA